RTGIATIKPIPHRLEIKKLRDDILLIDDTYNGNSNGFQEGINLLNKFTGRRKVYITPGLVETGKLAEKLHVEIGEKISNTADLVILIQNSVTKFIINGLEKNNFPKNKILIYSNAKIAFQEFWKHLKPGDVVLMQNDWSDNYY
ncbi:MAG: UDP-N-acetylmuramoyl-tripeptide--D-alanyl-D-alanine ligase, partial [Candidatus Dojkabacteria bacterium]|nr:UDP-N-acetylmuramoyl-tripeptide--D-alanyl-D-alanine ligase [Candidatus Dojkabacteria bacterium]